MRATVALMPRALWLTARARPTAFAACAAFACASGLLSTATAYAMKEVLDDVFGHGGGNINLPLGELIGLSVAAAFVPQANTYFQGQSRRARAAVMRDRLLAAVNSHTGIGRFEDPLYLDKLRLAQQAGGASDQVFGPGMQIVQSVISVSGFVAVLVALNPVLAAVAFAAGVPRLWLQIRLDRNRARMRERTTGSMRRQFAFQSLLCDQQAAKELRLFGLGEFFRARIAADNRVLDAAEQRMDRAVLLGQLPLSLLSALVSAAGLYWAVHAALAGRISVGDVTVFTAALAAIQGGLASIVISLGTVDQGLISFRYYLEILDDARPGAGPVPAPARASVLASSIPASSIPVSPIPVSTTAPVPAEAGGIEFDDVWFRYSEDAPWVLSGVSFRIRPGEATALVGLNGAGKSTLVKLLCRFYEPTEGAVRWDGVDIRTLDPTVLRARISAVFQDHMRYELTAAENIGMGDLARAADRAALVASAREAGIDALLAALPAGYDTPLSRIYLPEDGNGPVGVNLSGGQWQRIALARAFLRTGARLLILDEPSASLDAEAEYELHRRLLELRRDRSSLLVSHRLNTIRDADRIIVLSHGRKVEEGTHAALLAAEGEYARLFALQAEGYAQEPSLAGDPR